MLLTAYWCNLSNLPFLFLTEQITEEKSVRDCPVEKEEEQDVVFLKQQSFGKSYSCRESYRLNQMGRGPRFNLFADLDSISQRVMVMNSAQKNSMRSLKETVLALPTSDVYRSLFAAFIPVAETVKAIREGEDVEVAKTRLEELEERLNVFGGQWKPRHNDIWFVLHTLYAEEFHTFRYDLLNLEKVADSHSWLEVSATCWKLCIEKAAMPVTLLMPGFNLFLNLRNAKSVYIDFISCMLLDFIHENGGFDWQRYWETTLYANDFNRAISFATNAESMVFTIIGNNDDKIEQTLISFMPIFQDFLLILAKIETGKRNENWSGLLKKKNIWLRNWYGKNCSFSGLINVFQFLLKGEEMKKRNEELTGVSYTLADKKKYVLCQCIIECLIYLASEYSNDYVYVPPCSFPLENKTSEEKTLVKEHFAFQFRSNQGEWCSTCESKRWWEVSRELNELKDSPVFGKYYDYISAMLASKCSELVVPCFVCNYNGSSKYSSEIGNLHSCPSIWVDSILKHPFHQEEDRAAKRPRVEKLIYNTF